MLSESACSVVDLAGNEPVIHNEYIVSVNFRAMVDKMCFMAVYGSKTVLEAKVPPATRSAFHKLIVERHKTEGARDQFAAAWKAYLRANPTQEVDENAEDAALLAMMGADSDAEGGPAGGGGGADHAEATPPP
jgi:hypothetical protein